MMCDQRIAGRAAYLTPLSAALLAVGVALPQEHLIERVSVASDGSQADDRSWVPSISADGNRIGFLSWATNLVGGDTNACRDVFIRDRQLGETTRASISWVGQQGTYASDLPTLSGDGMHVVFEPGGSNFTEEDPSGCPSIVVRDLNVSETHAVNLDSEGNRRVTFCGGRPPISHAGQYVVFDSFSEYYVAGDTNDADDVFLRDRQAGTTERVSINSEEEETNYGGYSVDPSVSSDGRYVAFRSSATNLVAGDTNGVTDIFVRNRRLGLTERVSVSSEGAQADADCWSPYISPGGRYVAYSSTSTTLVPDDTNGKYDVFLHDRLAHTTIRVSVDSSGNQADGDSYRPAVSADGAFVAFESAAANLVTGDTNGVFDVFVHDTAAGLTMRVSLTGSGAEANDDSWFASIAADAPHCVAFTSSATNLVPGDDNGQDDIFVAFQTPLAVRWPRESASLRHPSTLPLVWRLCAALTDALLVAC